MTAAIAQNPDENNKARAYGAVFVNYHPYYYRGYANLRLGRYAEAVADLERATGAGEVFLGPLDDLRRSAGEELARVAALRASRTDIQGTWYDNYDAGIKAARDEDWPGAVDLMTRAIKENPKESNKARTYGAILINYHPYYYRGYASLKLQRYEDAMLDFQQTLGPGDLFFGSLDYLIERAQARKQPDTPKPTLIITTTTTEPPIAVPPTVPSPGTRFPRTEYILGWLLLALINTGVAQAKGLSGKVWFLVSLVLGPFATLWIVLQKPLV